MLNKDSVTRISAAQAYKHKWLSKKNSQEIDKEAEKTYMESMSKFYVNLNAISKVDISQTSTSCYDVHCNTINIKQRKRRVGTNIS